VPGFQAHITGSSILGVGYGLAGWYLGGMPPATAALGAGLCAAAGMLPDLDSGEAIPLRESTAFAAALVPLLMIQRFQQWGLPLEGMILAAAAIYAVVRFGLAYLIENFSKHRGMLHSVPAAVIAGQITFLAFVSTEPLHRYFIAGAHLVLDEIWAVNWEGMTFHLNQFAGSAVKMWSSSWPATILTYGILAALVYATYLDAKRFNIHPQNWLANFAPKLVPYVNKLEAKAGIQVTPANPGGAPAAVVSQPKTQTAPAQPVSRQPVPTQLIPSGSPQPVQPAPAPPGQLVAPSGFPAFFKPAGQ